MTLNDGTTTLTTVALTTLGTGTDATLNAVGTAAVNTLNQPAVVVNSAGGISAHVASITTAGDGATGAALRAADGVVFTADDAVRTVGNNAPGLNIQGSTISVASNLIQTQGTNANGVQLVSLSGPIDLNTAAIDTSGDNSSAALLRSAGNTDVNVGVLRTQGSQALGLDVATDPAACVLLGNGSCNVTMAADQITTNGFGGIGALVSAATGVTTIRVDALQTGGDEAAGLNLSANPTVCATLGAGACDQKFTVGSLTTQGAGSPGALVRAAGNISANANVLTTNGQNAAGLDLASDPDACVLLGKGQCGTSFNVGQLTTSGAGATGVLARVAGPTTGRVGILGTSGGDATGIDIAGDPTACVLIGSGACDVNLAANQVTTQGQGAAGVLVNAPANIVANIGNITTAGDNATGLGITTDPTLCVVLGPGACGISATTGPVTTSGTGSPGVNVDGGGDPAVVSTGPVATSGDDSGGVNVMNNGSTTVETGPVTTEGSNSPGVNVNGGNGPTSVTTGNITTAGDGSDGVAVAGTGLVSVTTGNVTTRGNGSAGVAVAGGDGGITVSYGTIVTNGNGSPGVSVSGNGPITIGGGSVTTSGDRSDGITVAGRTGVVRITAGPIITRGSKSDGIAINTTNGDQVVFAGPVAVSGAAANGIVAESSGCGAVNITATGAITSANGAGIAASSACRVSVTTRAGAPVEGRQDGIVVTSGTGSTIVVGDSVSSAAGPAIAARGAGAQVTIGSTGTLNGRVDLTDASDTLVNNGTFEATGDSAFGGGSDSFLNAGTLGVRRLLGTPGAVAFTGLESTTNSGLIDLRNGHARDTLTLPGTFNGTGGSTLAVDVSIEASGSSTDSLVIGGAATGRTMVLLQPLGINAGLLVNGLVVVDAGAGSSPTAFTLAGGRTTVGLVGYSLAFNPVTSDYALYGTPSMQAYELLKASEGARQIFYRTDDAWSGHMQSLRDGSSEADQTQRRGVALWGQAYGSVNNSRSREDVTAFGQSQLVALDNQQDFFGGQLGYDMGGINGDRGVVLGVTGGYASSTLSFRNNPDRIDYDAVNGGVYAGLKAGPIFMNLLGKYEHYWARANMPGAGLRQKIDGDSWGGKAEAGVRLGSDRFHAEPAVAIEFAHTSLDTLAAAPTTIDFNAANGLRGSAGLRLGTDLVSGAMRTSLYASGSVVHELEGRAGLAFDNGGQSVSFRNDRIGTYGHGTVGVNIASGFRVSGFIEANGDWSGDYEGGGGRAGINVRF